VFAAVDYLRTLPFADTKRIGIMGYSLGGIVTMFAVSRSTTFAVAINQAGAAGAWNISAEMRSALTAAAEKATTPALLLVAENDRITDSITTLSEIFEKRGMPPRMVVYEPFTPQPAGGAVTVGIPFNRAPGHEVFRAQGMHVWERDVLEFLAATSVEHLRGRRPELIRRSRGNNFHVSLRRICDQRKFVLSRKGSP
jgi:dienelactone hydrolase